MQNSTKYDMKFKSFDNIYNSAEKLSKLHIYTKKCIGEII